MPMRITGWLLLSVLVMALAWPMVYAELAADEPYSALLVNTSGL